MDFFRDPTFFGGKPSWFSRLHRFILQVHLIVFRRVGLVLPLFLLDWPFLPTATSFTSFSFSNYFFWVVKFCGPIHRIQQKHGHFSRKKHPFRWPRLSENAAQSDMSASGLRWRSWTCNRVATCATERTPGVNQIQGHAPKTVGMP